MGKLKLEPDASSLTKNERFVLELIREQQGENSFKPYVLDYKIRRPSYVCSRLAEKGFLESEVDMVNIERIYRLPSWVTWENNEGY